MPWKVAMRLAIMNCIGHIPLKQRARDYNGWFSRLLREGSQKTIESGADSVKITKKIHKTKQKSAQIPKYAKI